MGIFEQWLPDPGRFDRVNADGARNVVAAAREAGARRVVHTSTFDVFHAERGGTVSEARRRRPAEGHRLRALEAARRGARARRGGGRRIEVVICNPSGVFGPGPWAEAGLDARFATLSASACRPCRPAG